MVLIHFGVWGWFIKLQVPEPDSMTCNISLALLPAGKLEKQSLLVVVYHPA